MRMHINHYMLIMSIFILIIHKPLCRMDSGFIITHPATLFLLSDWSCHLTGQLWEWLQSREEMMNESWTNTMVQQRQTLSRTWAVAWGEKVSPGWRGYAEGINKRNEAGDAAEKRVKILKTRQESRPLCKETYHMSNWVTISKVKA